MAAGALTGAATIPPHLSAAGGSAAVPLGAIAELDDVFRRRNLAERSLRHASLPLQKRRFFCRSGNFLEILPDGRVRGSAQPRSKYGVLEFLTTMTVLSNFTQGSYSTPSTEKKLSIKGSKANMWLCMNSNGQLYSSASRTSDCEFHEGTVSSRRRTTWNVYYSTKYPINSSKKWYIAFDKRTGDPMRAMSSVKKTSKCATRGLHEDDIPSLRLPPASNRLFTTISPQRKPNTNKSQKTSNDGGDTVSHSPLRRTYSRKSRHRHKVDRSGELQLRSLEVTLLDDEDFLQPRKTSEAEKDSSSNRKKIRHENAKKEQSKRRRKTYSRLRPAG